MDPISALVYFLIALLSYLTSRKAGLSKGKAALVAAGVTGAAYVGGVGEKVSGWFSGGSPTDVPLDGSVGNKPGWSESVTDWFGGLSGIGKLAAAGGAAAGAGVIVNKGVGFVKRHWKTIVGVGAAYLFLTREKPNRVVIEGAQYANK